MPFALCTLLMERIYQNDKRYIMFDHVPDQRERWLRVSALPTIARTHNSPFFQDYLSNLSAPKLSVHNQIP